MERGTNTTPGVQQFSVAFSLHHLEKALPTKALKDRSIRVDLNEEGFKVFFSQYFPEISVFFL